MHIELGRPRTGSAIRRLHAGDQVQVIAVGKLWDEVVDPQTGMTGYVASNYLHTV